MDRYISHIHQGIYNIYDQIHFNNMDQGSLFCKPMWQDRHKADMDIHGRMSFRHHKHMYHSMDQGMGSHIIDYRNLQKFLKDTKVYKFYWCFIQRIAVIQDKLLHISKYYYHQNMEEDIVKHINSLLDMQSSQ
jgi:hypothetical protein